MAYGREAGHPPGSRFLYSDINFIVLGELVEASQGMPLDDTRQNIFCAAGDDGDAFPATSWRAEDRSHGIRRDTEQMLRGVVHDPTARRMGGVAGHAGLFSTADDLAKFAQAMLNGGRILSPSIVEKMTTPQQPPNATVRARPWLGYRFAVFRQPRRTVAGRIVRAHRVHRHLAVDRSDDEHLHHHSDQRGSSAREGKRVALALEDRDRSGGSPAVDSDEKKNSHGRASPDTTRPQTAARRVAVRNGSVKTGIDVLEDAQLRRADSGTARRRSGC